LFLSIVFDDCFTEFDVYVDHVLFSFSNVYVNVDVYLLPPCAALEMSPLCAEHILATMSILRELLFAQYTYTCDTNSLMGLAYADLRRSSILLMEEILHHFTRSIV
jgi:hypothetical protein